VTPGTNYTVTVGGGGSGATGNGGDSFFVSAATLVARGGRGAFINAQGDRAGGAGGTWEVGSTLTSSGGSNGGEGGGWLPDDSHRPVHVQQLLMWTEPHVMLGSLETAVGITVYSRFALNWMRGASPGGHDRLPGGYHVDRPSPWAHGETKLTCGPPANVPL
jgi:hypothetical protein